ncbi:MAG: hypothetical protein ACLQNE_20840 [Thermoguttaceae bacterium]
MQPGSRREFLGASIVGLGAMAAAGAAHSNPARRPRVPMIHGTDLFRPHNDPDDHWDLACVYALACQGDVNLLAVLIDFPLPQRQNDPDVLAVAQMNYLTGKCVPVIVGSPRWVNREDASRPEQSAALRGVRAVMDILRNSREAVVVNIVGSCRDVAMAAKWEPGLFAQKCAAVYLNAGCGTPLPSKSYPLEYNVALDPRAYAAIFDLPCPVFWMPCFETLQEPFQVSEFGTFYRFRQGDVLPHLSEGVQNFFAYVFRTAAEGKNPPSQADWLQYILAAQDATLHARVRAMERNMWCTAGFLHAAGLSVTCEGTIVPQAEVKDPVFTFDPIQATCLAGGGTQWRPDPASRRRFLFHVRNKARYATAMTSALGVFAAGSALSARPAIHNRRRRRTTQPCPARDGE